MALIFAYMGDWHHAFCVHDSTASFWHFATPPHACRFALPVAVRADIYCAVLPLKHEGAVHPNSEQFLYLNILRRLLVVDSSSCLFCILSILPVNLSLELPWTRLGTCIQIFCSQLPQQYTSPFVN